MLPQLLDPRPYFAHLPDPRRETQNKLHKLHDILMMVLCAVLSGVEDWVGMEAFAEEKETWLRGFLELPNGIPSHDTLSDVMGRIDPGAFQTAFTAWATAALPGLADEPVCVDGKAVRGSRKGDDPAVHLVSAFAGRARWVLAQRAVAEKSNEITAIPDLLGLLDLEGAVVSIDAMGCQKAIAQTIVDGGADYVLALKDNHPTLCEDVRFRLDAEVARLTSSICAKSAIAVRMGKQMFYRQLEMGVSDAYRFASGVMTCNMLHDDVAEGIDAFMEKRPPVWKGAD